MKLNEHDYQLPDDKSQQSLKNNAETPFTYSSPFSFFKKQNVFIFVLVILLKRNFC